MKSKISLLIIGMLLSIFISCNQKQQSTSESPKKYEMKIIKVDGIWRVVDATDTTKTKLQVHRKDTIVWTVEGTNAYFQFPDSIFKPVGRDDSLTNGYTKYIRSGHKLKLKIKDNAPFYTYVYAVFCSADSMFAQADSPPKIIIK